MKGLVAAVGTALFVVAVPLLIFSWNALALFLDPGLYSQGEIRHQVDQAYGLDQRLLVPVNRAIVRYFSGGSDTLAEALQAEGASPSFFNERETLHMVDVRALVRGIALVERLALASGLIYVLGSVALLGSKAVGRVGIGLIAGAGLGLLVVVVGGVFTLVDFSSLDVRLHLLLFTNDLWMLDPRTDHLIQMFPFPGFWRDVAIAYALRSLLTTVGTVVAGGFLVWLGRRLL